MGSRTHCERGGGKPVTGMSARREEGPRRHECCGDQDGVPYGNAFGLLAADCDPRVAA